MRHRIGIGLLALGTVLGYGFAFHSMRHHRDHREAFERHIASVCLGAANSLKNDKPAARAGEPATTPGEPAAP